MISTFAAPNSDQSLPVPESVQKNCLLTSSGGIDSCPEYRAQIGEMNRKLFQRWSDAETK